MFQIHKYEKDVNEDGQKILNSFGTLPYKYISEEQALLKIKTLDKGFVYLVEEEVVSKFYHTSHLFTNTFYNPIEDVEIVIHVGSHKGTVTQQGEEIGIFYNKRGLFKILEEADIPTDGLIPSLASLLRGD